MSIAMRGLKLKPAYEGLINVAVSDKLSCPVVRRTDSP